MSNYKHIGGTNQQTYCIEANGPGKTPRVGWAIKNFQAKSAPLVHQNVLYISQSEKFNAIDASTGKDLWTIDLPGQACPPTIFEEKLFVGGFYLDDYLYALDIKTGKEIWKYRTASSDAGVLRSPIIEDDTIIFAAGRTVHALDIASKKAVWKYKLGERTAHHPVTSGGGMLFTVSHQGSGKNKIHGFDMQDGKGVWKIEAFGLLSHLVFINDTLIYADWENNINFIDPASGTRQQFKVKEGKNARSAYLSSNGEYLLIVLDYHLVALHFSTGQWSWVFQSKGVIGQPVIANGVVYFSTCFDGIYGLDLFDGKPIFHLPSEVRSTYACGLEGGVLFHAGSMNEYELSAYQG